VSCDVSHVTTEYEKQFLVKKQKDLFQSPAPLLRFIHVYQNLKTIISDHIDSDMNDSM